MELNIISFSYLFLRLAPFILVSFFTLASIFNQDFKGLIYLIGLIFTCFCSIMIGNVLPIGKSETQNEICNLITIGNTSDFSNLPVGQTIFGYTAAYLMYVIIKNKLVSNNIPTIVFFPVIIVLDAYWNFSHGCHNPLQLIAALGLGIGFGSLWAYIIDSTKVTKLQYFNNISGKEICSRPAKNTFACKVYKNGKLLSDNFH